MLYHGHLGAFDNAICGVDEVGRGPIAGPVVAAAVILRRPIDGLDDSKKLKATVRERLAQELMLHGAAAVGIGAASVAEIERLNIRGATFLAMRRAVQRLPETPRRLLVDGRDDPATGLPTETVIGGDAKVPQIAAASILAKVLRDALMARLAGRFPAFGWERNAGYPTASHRAALAEFGPTAHHRRGFAPVRAWLENHPSPL